MKTNYLLSIIIATVSILLLSCGSDDPNDESGDNDATENLNLIISELGKRSDYSMFAEALKSFDISDLEAETFTLFAVRNSGLEENNTQKKVTWGFSAQETLGRHIVGGSYDKDKLKAAKKVYSANGTSMEVGTDDEGNIYINNLLLGEIIEADKNIIYLMTDTIPRTCTPELNYVLTYHDRMVNLIRGKWKIKKHWKESYIQYHDGSIVPQKDEYYDHPDCIEIYSPNMEIKKGEVKRVLDGSYIRYHSPSCTNSTIGSGNSIVWDFYNDEEHMYPHPNCKGDMKFFKYIKLGTYYKLDPIGFLGHHGYYIEKVNLVQMIVASRSIEEVKEVTGENAPPNLYKTTRILYERR